MNIAGIIPARMESSRFPGKPLKKINGIPLIEHVYYRSRMCNILTDVYVATPNQEIKDHILSIGGKAVLTSDKHERPSDCVSEAMLKIEAESGVTIDIAAMIQGDEPMLKPEMIYELVKPYEDDGDLMITNLMTEIKSRREHDDPNNVKVVVDKDNYALYYSREPIPSWKKGAEDVRMLKQTGIISYRRDALVLYNSLPQSPLEIFESVDMLRVLENGYKVKMIQTNNVLFSVDTQEDLNRVEEAMRGDPLVKEYPLSV